MENNYFTGPNNAWLQKRLGRFTASEIHKIFQSGRKKGEMFGQGAMTYIRTKAAELLTMEVKEDIDFKQGEWGKANERDAVLTMEKLLGVQGKHYGMIEPEFFSYGAFAGCSPDWESMPDGADVKCPYNSAEHVKNLMLVSADEFREERWEYYCQLQMSIIVRKWEKAYFFSYDPRMVEQQHRYKILTIYPDSVWQKEFHERITAGVELVNSILETIMSFEPIIN